MIKALPVVSSLRLTLLAGEFSTKVSRLGILSPTLMNARGVVEKVRKAWGAAKRRIANLAAIL